MLKRLLILLGMSISLAVAVPLASSAAPAKVESETVAKKKLPKKTTAKKDNKKKQATKKGATKKPVEEAAKERPKTLFSTLFGGPIKPKAEKQTTAKASAKEAPRKLAPLKPIDVKPVALSAEEKEIVQNGNNGELRSGQEKTGGLMASLFGAEDQMLPATRALDAAQRAKDAKRKPFEVAEQYRPQVVEFSGYPAGTIVVDTANHFLYLVESRSKARRYGIAVGKDGLKFKGNVTVGDKQEWPRWIPTKEMQQREPKKYGQYADGMPGGGANPLGARAIYLYQGKRDTHLRIHGTIAPQSIGTDSSNGCFRMVNEHVIDLYRRVRVGTNVIVL